MADEITFTFDSTDNNYELGSGGLAEALRLLDDADRVAYGLGLSADYTNLLLDVGSGGALIRDGTEIYGVLPDARSDLSLSGDTVNEVFLVLDVDASSVSIDIRADGTTPTNPHVEIGEVDTSANTTTELNRGDGSGGVSNPMTQALDAASNDITNVGALDTDELSVTQGRGLLGLPNHHVNYASGLSTEELARFTLAAGDELEVWRLEASLKGGGTDSNVTLDVYDASTSTVLASTTAGSRTSGGDTPLGTSGAGSTILIRLSTGSSAVDLCATGVTSVVGN